MTDILNKWLEEHKDAIEAAVVQLGKVLQPLATEAFAPLVNKKKPKTPADTEVQKKKDIRRFHAIVERVIDGDTVELQVDIGFGLRLQEPCRLLGINAPEMTHRPAGQDAKDHLCDLIGDACNEEGELYADIDLADYRDKYGRLLVTLFGKGEKTSINQKMIDDGHSVEYKGYIQDLDFRKYEELVSLMTRDGNDHDVDTAIENAKTHQRWRVLVPLYKELNKAVQDLDLHDDIAHTLWPILKKIREAERNVY